MLFGDKKSQARDVWVRSQLNEWIKFYGIQNEEGETQYKGHLLGSSPLIFYVRLLHVVYGIKLKSTHDDACQKNLWTSGSWACLPCLLRHGRWSWSCEGASKWMTQTSNLNAPKFNAFRLSTNFGEKGRPPCAQVSRNAWEDIRRMTKKMAHNREKMRAKLNVLKFILVLYSRPHISCRKESYFVWDHLVRKSLG